MAKLYSGESIARRELLVGASAMLLASCGGGGTSTTSGGAAPTPPPSPAPTPASTLPEGLGVRQFYRPEHGSNLQPAFQAAIDHAASKGLPKIVNDLGAISGEMWCPPRSGPFMVTFMSQWGPKPSGVPLVVYEPVHLDFQGAKFTLKGPTGGDRMVGQPQSDVPEPWLGGWMYVVGHKGFGRITVENVTVDGTFAGDVMDNRLANLSDRGFAIQDTEVAEIYFRNVEMRNFAAEIFYVAGSLIAFQHVENCHFHGSPQCAWNGGGIGGATVIDLQAGRSYQPAEIVCGRGHTYKRSRFYDGSGGVNFFGGPSPSFVAGYPYWYSLWDGQGSPPWTTFEATTFERIQHLSFGSWMRGAITVTDTPVIFLKDVGHLRDIDLRITSVSDTRSLAHAIQLQGPPDQTTQAGGAPAGTYLQKPSDLRLALTCRRTREAAMRGFRHHTAISSDGGLLDSRSVAIELSGEAGRAWRVDSSPAPGFETPQIAQTGFVALG